MRKLLLTALLATTSVAPAHAEILLDQLTGVAFTNSTVFNSQDFESTFNIYDVAVVDDFTIGADYTLTNIAAALGGYNGYNGTAGIAGYQVNIYSAPSAAGASIIGDIASLSLLPGEVTVTPSGVYDLVSADINIALTAGTYYFSLVAINNFASNGQVGIVTDLDTASNGFQANPGGGFGAGTTFAFNPTGTAGYRITGDLTGSVVPEPASWAMMIGGFGLVGGALRRRSSQTLAHA